MAAQLMAVHLDMNGNQILKGRAEVLSASPGSPLNGQFWYRSNVSNGTANGALFYRDESGNDIQVATGSSALSNAYATITDGTTPASASGADTVKFRATGTGLTIATQSNDATHGDNVNYTLGSATSGATKVLLTDASGGIAHNSYVLLGTGGTTAGQLGFASTKLTLGKGGSSVNVVDTGGDFTINGTLSFNGPPIMLAASGTIAGAFGYTGGFLTYGDGSVQQTVVSVAGTQTLTNKTLTNPVIGGGASTTSGVLGFASSVLRIGNGTTAETVATDTNTMTFTNKSFGSNVAMGTFRITGLGDPTAAQDGATKAYVDATAAGIDWKASVRVATTANVATLAGGAPNTVDGVTLAANDRILVKNQTTTSTNGIYTVTTVGTGANGTWARASDADTNAEVTSGIATYVSEGTVNAGSGWVLTTPDFITLGTTGLTFTQFTGLGMITAGAGLTQTGNTIDVVANANGTIVVAANDVSVSTGLAAVHTLVTGAGTTGLTVHTGANTVTARSLATANAARITVTNGDGVAGNPTVDLATTVTGATTNGITYDNFGRITAAADLIASNGLVARTAAGTWAARSLATASSARITVTNGDGVAGNPTVDLASGIIGTPGPYDNVTVDTYGRVTAGVAKGFAQDIGNGSLTTITVTHNLGTKDVIVSVYDKTTPFGEVIPEIRRSGTTTVDLLFNVAPTTNQYRVVVLAV